MREEPQECKDHAMWQRNFSWAYWAFLIASIIVAAMGRPFELALAYFGMSGIMLTWSVISTLRHAKWHTENNERHIS